MWWNDIKEINERLHKIETLVGFSQEDEFRSAVSLDTIRAKLDAFIEESGRIELSIKILDKFEDYMKNIDKINSMMNEFKGCVAMARGACESSKKKAKKSKKKTTSKDL